MEGDENPPCTATMIKRTLEISREPTYLSVRLGQLQLKQRDQLVDTIPCEDLGVVVVDQPQTTYSHAALTTLLKHDAVVVLCGSDHLPSGMLLPIAEHTLVVPRLRAQVNATVPTRKRLWREIVRAKILAQAANLDQEGVACRRLREYARQVRSGDPDNREAQAARRYWSAWLLDGPPRECTEAFRRDPDAPGINALLNYGYAVMRAAVARAIVAAGLHPAFGLHHSNRSNAFCLADDLVEPLRPLVDARVRDLAFSGELELTQPVKAQLLELLTQETKTGDFSGPLFVALHRYVSSLVAVLEGQSRVLAIPTPCDSPATAACG